MRWPQVRVTIEVLDHTMLIIVQQGDPKLLRH